ncbi:MAG: hypothetical protein WBA17_17805 [Saprospiraceae bacterium]
MPPSLAGCGRSLPGAATALALRAGRRNSISRWEMVIHGTRRPGTSRNYPPHKIIRSGPGLAEFVSRMSWKSPLTGPETDP